MLNIKIKKIFEEYSIIIITILILLFFSMLTPDMLKINNLINLLQQVAIISIGAVGMTFAITGGGFDLSVGSILTLGSCIFAIMLQYMGLVQATVVTLFISVIWGAFNGFLISKLHLQAFVATLATMILFRGIALVLTKGKDIDLYTYDFIKVFTVTRILGIPLPVIFMLIFYLLSYFIYKKTVFGIFVRSIGCNNEISKISGVPVFATTIGIYIITSLTATFSGILITSQLLFSNSKLGIGYETDVISAVILGGTALAGGRGKIWGTFFGVILLGIIKNGLNLLGAGDAEKRLVTGIILLAAVAFNLLIESRKKEN